MKPAHGRQLPERPDCRPVTRANLAARCWRGDEPAEALLAAGMHDEHNQLLYECWAAGWTDVEIATHTRHSTYTTGRFRERYERVVRDTPYESEQGGDQANPQPVHNCHRTYPQCCAHTCPYGDPHREMTGGICRCCLNDMNVVRSPVIPRGVA